MTKRRTHTDTCRGIADTLPQWHNGYPVDAITPCDCRCHPDTTEDDDEPTGCICYAYSTGECACGNFGRTSIRIDTPKEGT